MAARARAEELFVEEVGEETLVYDTRSDVCRVLNRTTAVVWNHCDGARSVSDLARILAQQTGMKASEEIVYLALEELDKAELLDETEPRPLQLPRTSRRQLLRQLGVTAGMTVAIPVVQSVFAPSASAQASPGPTTPGPTTPPPTPAPPPPTPPATPGPPTPGPTTPGPTLPPPTPPPTTPPPPPAPAPSGGF